MLAPVSVGSRILVIGAGIIGNLWVSVLHLHGHRKVTVSEPNETRLNYVKKLGEDHIAWLPEPLESGNISETGFELVTPSQLQKNREADPNYAFEVVIDCSGFCPAVEHGLSLLTKGGKLCCFGIPPPDKTIKQVNNNAQT